MEDEYIDEKQVCPNCQHQISYNDTFCANCGQKNQRKIPKLMELLSSFFDSILNIDSKIFKTFIAICIPGRLTTNFFKGIRKKYYHPFRLFFFVAVLFFALLGATDLKKGIIDGVANDSFKDTQNNTITLANIKAHKDSIALKFGDTTFAATVLDSLQGVFEQVGNDSMYFEFLYNKKFVLSRHDLIVLSEKELLKKYEITDFWEKLFIKQTLKTIKDPANFIWHLIGNFIWMLIFLMPAVALVLKMLYIRRKRYYVEHLTFLFHFHAFIFFIGSIGIMIQTKMGSATVVIIGVVGVAFYLYMAMKRFYQQGWLKTFFKFWFLLFSYGLLSLLFFVALTIISLAMY